VALLQQAVGLALLSGDRFGAVPGQQGDLNGILKRQSQFMEAGDYAAALVEAQKAEALAKEKGWAFNWKKVEAPNVPHSSEEMFKHDRCLDALGWVGKK